jgi:hypothetical protein
MPLGTSAVKGVADMSAAVDTSDHVWQQQRHEVGVMASRVLELLEDDPSRYALYYRYRVTGRWALRTGLGGAYSSRGSGRLEVRLRAGADYAFRRQGNWAFYVGLDAIAGHERRDDGARRRTSIGAAPLLGAAYHIGRFFSISTEPRLRITRERSRGAGPAEQWTEGEFRGVGQVRLNLRF